MHGHGSARVERVRTGVFWVKSKSGRYHSLALRPDDGDNVRGTERAETLGGRVVADCGSWVTSMFSQAEEIFDSRSNWAGCRALQFEVRDGLTSNVVLLVFQGEDDLGDVLEPLDRGIGGEEGVADDEDEVLEWTELDFPYMDVALSVLTSTQEEVEPQDN